MSKTSLLALTLTGFAVDGAPQTPRKPAVETDGNRLVRVALHADREAIEAGKRFQICVELTVKPGWHIYWENAGDAGIATVVDVSGPEGFEIGPVRFPCPAREETEGDIVSYIHAGRVLLALDVQAPAKLDPGTVLSFRVECEWLVCTDYCLPGSGKSTLELAAASAEGKPANAKLFAEALAALPRAWKDVISDVKPVVVRDGDTTRVTIEVPDAFKLEYFPRASLETQLVRRTLSDTGKGTRLELVFEQMNGARDVDWRGVLWIQDKQGQRSCTQEELLRERP